MSTYNDTTLNNLSQDFLYDFYNRHSLSSIARRALAAFCIVMVGANQKDFVTSTSGCGLAPYSGNSQQNMDIGMQELVRKGIIRLITKGNGVSCSIYAPNNEVVNFMYLVKLELQSIWISNKDNCSLINNYKNILFTTWSKSWILSPALATRPGVAKVCAVMAVKGLTGAKDIALEIGVSARAVRRTLTILSNLGVADGGKIDKVKEFVYTYLGLEDYLETTECEEVLKKKETRLKKYQKHIMDRAGEVVHIIKYGAFSPKAMAKGIKDVRMAKNATYTLKDGEVTYTNKDTGLALYSTNIYKDVKKFDMYTAQSSINQSKRLDLSVMEVA